MDFRLTEEQQMLQDSARRLLEADCALDKRGPATAAGGFDAGHWASFAEMGWFGILVPEELGGIGFTAIEAAILMEEVGRTLCVEPLWAVAFQAVPTIVAAKDAAKAEALLPAVVEGTLKPVLAHGEDDAGGVLEWVRTTATAAAEGWTLTGTKSLVVGGNVADCFIVSARTAGAPGDAEGITLFVVPKDAPGLTATPVRLVDNRWAVHLDLTDVAVTQADVLGTVGGGLAALREGNVAATVTLCAEALGVMDRALWTTRDYLLTRKQFGVTLSTFQSLQHRMSDMLMELELSRCMVYRALGHLDAAAEVRAAALSSMKYQVGTSGKFVCGQGIQLHGGIGVTEEYSIGHYYKRMVLIEYALGNSHQHLQHLARREQAREENLLTHLS
jgi:alkylation response protein AidB-like acyl-CoA dehydrogenase